jgi:flagellar protein FlgJ
MMNSIEKIQNTPAKQRQMDTEKEKKLRKTCADFEALVTYNLLKTMRRTIPAGGALPRSSSRDTYETMLDQNIAEAIARKGQGVGLQKILYDQLSQKYRKTDSSSSGNTSINKTESPAGDI